MHWFRKIFIPHEENDGEPHVFRDASVEVLLFLAILGFTLALGQRILFQNTNMLAAIYSNALVEMTNENRKASSLADLTVNPVLEIAAGLKADDMASKGYFAHYSPEGISPWYWMRIAGYKYQYAGENLAIDFYDSADVSRAWMNSPTHRANVLNGRYTEIGIAMRQGTYQGRPTTYVVQMFGSPAGGNSIGAAPKNLSLAASVGPFFDFALSNPRYMIGSLYGALVLMVLLGFIGLASVEWRRRHAKHLLYGLLLLLIIATLSFIYSSGSAFPEISSL